MPHAPLTFTISAVKARVRELRMGRYPDVSDTLYADETAVVKIADLLQASMLENIRAAVQVGMLLHPERTHAICTKFSGECAAEVLPHILAAYPAADAVKRVVAAISPDGDIETTPDSLRDDIDAVIALSEDAYEQMNARPSNGRDRVVYYHAFLVLSIVYRAGLLRSCSTIWQYAQFMQEIASSRCNHDISRLENTTHGALHARLQRLLIALFNGEED